MVLPDERSLQTVMGYGMKVYGTIGVSQPGPLHSTTSSTLSSPHAHVIDKPRFRDTSSSPGSM